MGDSAAEGRLGCLFFVDVDELVIVGAVGKFVDALLAQFDPGTGLKLVAHKTQKLVFRYDLYAHVMASLAGG